MTVAIVVPTIGRPQLRRLVESLVADGNGPLPLKVVLVDDRPRADGDPLTGVPLGWLAERLVRRRSGGRGPAVARNVGWRSVRADWIAFLDDDVLVGPGWLADLHRDLAGLDARVGGSQGRVTVPLPAGRRPTDWERNTAALATARWITADMAYRRPVLAEVGGFDERFPTAFREDADLALRVQRAGYTLTAGRRRIEHPIRPAPWSASIRAQRGNADDALMRRLHGRRWTERAGVPAGRRPRHLAITGCALAAASLALARQRRTALAALAIALGGVAEFAAARILAGPPTANEVVRMLATSLVIPEAATAHWLRGVVRHRRTQPWTAARRCNVAAVLVDRDGTLVHDVPYNSDPAQVDPIPGVRQALDRLRDRGLTIGVVTNQSGIARGRFDLEGLAAVNARVDELLGPFDAWCVCPHDEASGCACRKPRAGLIEQAAAELGVPTTSCIVIGDTGADVEAAERAGAVGVLVPTEMTRDEEVRAARTACATFGDAAQLILQMSRASR
jgi:histidinol-phosphate phosphatase family protein